MNNSIVKLKGLNEPIIVSKVSAQEVQKIFENKNVDRDFVIRIGNKTFIKGDIKFVEVLNDGSDSRKFDEITREFYAEERRNHDALSKRSPEYKSKLLDLFIQLYKIITDTYPSQDEILKAEMSQLKFFTENPQRTLVDFTILKPLLPSMKDGDSHLQWPQLMTHLKIGFVGIVHRAIARDMELSK